ncbi:enoyl-CoA hydratase [Tomitella fengzijianii]|uniref:Enoyl-CoA hydratase n=1 Tax=Tomitella fengzijianii TaxID=2597660 RepID=A0A516X1Q0_9ACTN|nr:enoyl-CoA hydratase [Tomitella fengzijianii]QDQ96999.1 enoyl-CoA hydratase [Tomitella fengzijianii]
MTGTDAESAKVGVLHEGAVAVLELQRQDKRNALNTSMCDAIREAVAAAAADGARAVVITGAGSAFCAGADLSGDVYSSRFPLALVHMLHTIEQVPVPVIAAVNGPAIGAGTQLAMACDLRVVDEGARFQIPVVKVGLAVHNWTVRKLTEMVGGGHARTMLLGAEQLDSERAGALGLANRIGDVAAAREWAAELAGFAPLSLQHLKMVFNDDGGRSKASDEQTELFNKVWASEDKSEASRARREGRAPRFQGA